MAPKRSSTRNAAAAAVVQGARVSKARAPRRKAVASSTTEQAQRLLLEEQIQQKKKEVKSCRAGITRMKKALAAEEAKLAKSLSALEELEKDLAKQAEPAASRATRRRGPTAQTSEKTGCGIAQNTATQAAVPPPRAPKRERKRKLPQDAEVGAEAKRCKIAEAEAEKEQEVPSVPPSRPEDAGSRAKAGSPSPQGEEADAKDNETRPEAARSTWAEEDGETNSVSEPVGLPNPGNACFANSVMQFLATALGTEAVEGLAVDEGSASLPGTSTEDCIQLSRSRTGGRSMLARKLAELRRHITEAGRDREIPISGLLGRALKEVLSGDEDSSAAATFMLRQVFAYSAGGKFRDFNGDSQQDASEYLIRLLDALVDESPAVGGPLTLQMQETIGCECGGVASVNLARAATSLQLTIPPLAANQSAWGVQELVEHEMGREHLDGYVCSKCNRHGFSSRTKEMVICPERLLVVVNRTSWINGKKISTPVVPPFGEIRVGTESYRMTAVIQHRGTEINSGHYVAFRKQKTWVELDDDKVKQEDVAVSMQDTQYRSSAVFLLEKS